MAKGIELTVAQASEHPAAFMYVWATDAFLNAINQKYARVIRVKRYNQKKVLRLSADKYEGGFDKVNKYYNAIKNAFVEQYGMTPYNALIVLAQGGEVAGKNWAEGVYGIGSLSTKFSGTDITVNPKNGYMMRNGQYLPVYDTVYAEIKGKTIAYQLFYYEDATGRTYMSQYNKTLKKYYAQSYSTAEAKYSASGKEIKDSDSASIWGNITLDWDWIQKVINWFLSLFGVSPMPTTGDGTTTDTLSTENTLPSQTGDGFVQESSISEAAAIALLLLAGGTFVAGGFRKKKNK